jgi:hypothetical protein
MQRKRGDSAAAAATYEHAIRILTAALGSEHVEVRSRCCSGDER